MPSSLARAHARARAQFQDPRVNFLLDTLHREFATVEKQMEARDRHRYMSYPYLFPSNAQNSIFI